MPTKDHEGFPAFSRGSEASVVELRGEIPRWIIDVVDAVVMARGGQSANIHRTTVVSEVLGHWAKARIHEATLVTRLSVGNPTGSDIGGGHH